MFLKVYTPSPPLQPHIARLWIFESNGGIPSEDLRVIVPNAQLKIIIPFKNGLRSIIKTKETLAKESSIALVGMADVPAIIEAPSQDAMGTIGIEFHPGSAYKFFRLPLCDITNFVSNLDDVLGKEGTILQRMLEESGSPEERIKKVEHFLISLLMRNSREDTVLDFCIREILAGNGRTGIEELTAKTGYSRRYIEMKFMEKLGISAKTFSSITRFQRFYKGWVLYKGNRFFEQDIYEYYYDQSHFIKEFKRFTGMSPTRFMKNENEFGNIFYKD